MSSYVIANPQDLDGKGIDFRYAERLPDGRVILPFSSLRVLTDIQITLMEESSLKDLIRRQNEEGIGGTPVVLPEFPEDGNTVDTPIEQPEEVSESGIQPDVESDKSTES